MSTEPRELIGQGAEARVYSSTIFGLDTIIKERFAKTYRIPEIDDALRKKRTLMECRALLRCLRFNIRAPFIYYVDMDTFSIFMERINGPDVKTFLRNLEGDTIPGAVEASRQMAAVVRAMHDRGLIHGDLTTSNFIQTPEGVVPIDFGLAYQSDSVEDRAVDLYVLERAMESTHAEGTAMFEAFMKVYNGDGKMKAVVNRLDVVRARGRKKDMVG